MDPDESLMASHDVAIPNRQVWKRPTIVNHYNDGESHEVAIRNLIVSCVHLIIEEACVCETVVTFFEVGKLTWRSIHTYSERDLHTMLDTRVKRVFGLDMK